MSRWFRLDDDVVNDPKVQSLPDTLFRAWINILCVASKHDGKLPALRDTAFILRANDAKAAEMLTKLCQAGLLDRDGDTFTPHNWDRRQYKSDVSTDRVKRFRNGNRNVSCNVSETGHETETETPPETETETETHTETEKKDTREVALADDWPDDYRVVFWNTWPNKVGKPKAIIKLERCRKRGVSWALLIEGVHRYIRTKPPDRAWMNPETFLNGERWNDLPAEVSSGKSESLASVAQRQAEAGISFGPRPTGLRLVEGGNDVRLLSEAGRERP